MRVSSLLTLMAALTGCVSLLCCAALPDSDPATGDVPPGAPPPLSRNAASAQARAEEARDTEPRVLEFEDLAQLVDDSPAMQAEREEIARQSGLVVQGSYMPNPVLRLETEMMPIDDVGFGNSRNKVVVKQRIETAGKAGDRVAAAEASRRVAEAAYYQRRSEIQAEAAGLFDAIMFTRREIAVRQRIRGHRDELHRLAEDLNRSGRLADKDLIDFEVAKAHAVTDLLRAEEKEYELVAKLEGLLALPPGTVAGCSDRDVEWEPDEWETASADILFRNPELVKLDRAVAAAAAQRDLMESGAWTDVTVGLGYMRGFNMEMERDDFAMGFVEMPLPLVDRNQGGVQSAEAAMRRAERMLEAAASEALDRWQGLKRRWEVALANRVLHADRIVPRLEEVREMIRESAAAGRLPPQEGIEAALKVEEEVLHIVELDRSLAEMRIGMIELQGREQR